MTGTATAVRRVNGIIIKKSTAKAPAISDPADELRADIGKMRREHRAAEAEAQEVLGNDENNRLMALSIQRNLVARLNNAGVGTRVELDWSDWSPFAQAALAMALLGNTGYDRLTQHPSFTASADTPPLAFEKLYTGCGEPKVKIFMGTYRLCVQPLAFIVADELWSDLLPELAGAVAGSVGETLAQARREYAEAEKRRRGITR